MGAQDTNQTQETPITTSATNGGSVEVEQVDEVIPDGVTPPAPVPIANNNNGSNANSYKGNEDRKIFVGGIAYDVTNEDLTSYFSQFGDVSQAQVKFDRSTGRSRGFAFVEFATADACKQALGQREQQIKNKQCEIKPAKSRENKKVFVGGLPADHPEEELKKHFEAYGKVEDIEWPFDKQTKARRNFAFIVFEEEDAADRAAREPKQTFGSRECDVKKAVPQSKRNNFANNFLMGRGGLGGMRMPYGTGGGLRGGPPMGGGMHTGSATQWYNNGGWPQMGSMGGVHGYAATGSTGGGGAGGWGDWNSYAAGNAAANFYAPTGGNSGSSFGAFGTNGYDQYSQGGGTTHSGAQGMGARSHQNGSSTTANQRY